MRAFPIKLGACTLGILAVEHFRDDGTCRCDDPTHKEMAEWGWRWSEAEKRWVAPDAL